MLTKVLRTFNIRLDIASCCFTYWVVKDRSANRLNFLITTRTFTLLCQQRKPGSNTEKVLTLDVDALKSEATYAIVISSLLYAMRSGSGLKSDSLNIFILLSSKTNANTRVNK